MSKIILVLSVLLGLTSLSLAAPVFMKGASKIRGFQDQLFLQTNQFVDLMNKEYFQGEEKPSRVYLFDVSVKDKKLVDDARALLNEISSKPAIRNFFESNSYVSPYIEDAHTKDFHDQIVDSAKSSDYSVITSDLKSFEFDKVAKSLKKASDRAVNVIHLEMKDLPALDKLFKEQAKQFKDNYLVMLKFSDDATAAPHRILSLIEENERILDSVSYEQAGSALQVGQDPDNFVIPISAAGFSGFLTGILALIAVYIGCDILMSIKTPTRFYDRQFHIGREH